MNHTWKSMECIQIIRANWLFEGRWGQLDWVSLLRQGLRLEFRIFGRGFIVAKFEAKNCLVNGAYRFNLADLEQANSLKKLDLSHLSWLASKILEHYDYRNPF